MARPKGFKHTLSTRAKITAANTGRIVSPTTRAALSAACKGRKLSLETRAKISAALTGRKCPDNAERNRSPEMRAVAAAAGLGNTNGLRHGHARRPRSSRTYNTWASMLQRCTNPTATGYPDYGGRGISVCPAWATSFDQFLADLGERPPGTNLDRWPDNDGNCAPGNVRWATRSEQRRNRRGVK